MACCPTEKSYGYESCRFEKDVDEHFHCSICYNVLKEPRTCRNNEHMFCLACITEHLKVNSKACPECNEHLSVDTLRRPRVVNNILSKLKIKCDYASRGCPQFVCVEELQTHVENCGFAPVLCSNDECRIEINKQDKVYHETEVCGYRKVKCHECRHIQEVVGRLEEKLTELDKKVEATRAETRQEIETVNKELKKEVKDVKKNVSQVSKDVEEVKLVMIQMLAKLNKLELLNRLPTVTEGIMNTPREDILIAGGGGSLMLINDYKRSAEIYSWEKNGWFKVSEMNEKHFRASSFIYKYQLFVVGGAQSKIIETLDLNNLPLKWMKFPGELPYQSDDHQTVVFQQRIIHIGGFDYGEYKLSDVVSEFQLKSPYAMKKLCQMPEPRQCHSAEILEDKVLIMGGENRNDTSALDGVLEFDVTRNKCKKMLPLPRALKKMATVCWREKVVVLGGQDKDGDVLNDVFMYDCKTGKITTLPSMLEKRCQCCAVITGNTIVVMGGKNEEKKILSSVECFKMGGSTWEYLPCLNEARWGAVAEILPLTQKYV